MSVPGHRVRANQDRRYGNRPNKQPLPGVSVTLKGTTKGTVTDLNGRFLFTVEKGQVLSFNLRSSFACSSDVSLHIILLVLFIFCPFITLSFSHLPFRQTGFSNSQNHFILPAHEFRVRAARFRLYDNRTSCRLR